MRLFLLFGGLVVVALLTALIAPPFVNWDQFRERFENEATAVLGHTVKVGGQTSFRILPLPSLTFQDIKVGDNGEGDPLLAAESFKLDVELAPLLKGDLVIVDMQLVKPVLDIRIDREGSIGWDAAKSNMPRPLQGGNIVVENIAIIDGIFRIRDARFEREFLIQKIDATSSASSLSGPWRAQGQASYLGNKTRFSFSTGQWQSSQSISVKLTAEPQVLPYDFQFDGPLSFIDSVASLAGKLRVNPISDQTDSDSIAFRRPDPSTALPVRLESDIQLLSGGATVPAFQLEVGDRTDPYTVTGSGSAKFGEELSFRIRAEGQQINIERLGKSDQKNEEDKTKSKNLSQRFALVRDILEQVPRFKTNGEIALYLPAIIAGDTVVRDVGMDLRPLQASAGWQVKNLEAQLPGRTDLRADGSLILGEDFRYDGSLILASRQPTGFARWLGDDSSPYIRELSTAGFSADTKISPEEATFQNLEVVLNGKRMIGQLSRKTSQENSKPLLDVDLQGDVVNFDQLNALFGLFTNSSDANSLGTHDLTLNLKAGTLEANQIVARQVVADVSLIAGNVTINELTIGDLQGASVSARGSLLRSSDNKSLDEGSLTGAIDAKSLAPLIGLLQNKTGPIPFATYFANDSALTSNTKLAFKLTAQQSGASISVTGSTGGSEFDGQFRTPVVALPSTSNPFKAKMVLVSANTASLLQQIGLPIIPIETQGRAAVRLELDGSVKDGLQTIFVLTTKEGFLSAGGLLQPEIRRDTVALSGSLRIDSELTDFDSVVLLSGLPLPGFGQGYKGELKSHVLLEPGQYKFTELAGRFAGSDFAGALEFDNTTWPRPTVVGKLSVSELPLSIIPNLVFVGGDPVASDVDASEIGPVFAGIDAKVDLFVEQTRILGDLSLDVARVSRLKSTVNIQDGDISLKDINAFWLDGTLNGSVSLAKSGSARLINGQLALKEADFALVSWLANVEPIGSATVDISGNFETAGENTADLIAGLTGTGAAQIYRGRLSTFDENSLTNILRMADLQKDQDLDASVGTIVGETLYSGELSFDDTDIALSLASGVLRSNNIVLKNEKVKITNDLRYDFNSQTINVDSKVTFDAGKEFVTGASPELSLNQSGPVTDLKSQQDTSLFATYLGMRASERKQREFDEQRSAILERQRLQVVARLYTLKEKARELARQESARIERVKEEQAEQKRLQALRQKREEITRKKLEAELKDAEETAVQEAAAEAGRRERRQEEIDRLRQRTEDALKRARDNLKDQFIIDGDG